MKESKRMAYHWRGVKKTEVMVCLIAWLVLLVCLPQETKIGWLGMGLLLFLLGLKSYGSGISYNEDEWMSYSFGRKKVSCSWEGVKEIQIVSKRTGLFWRKHYALGFFGWDEVENKRIFLGVSPTVVLKRLEHELSILDQHYPLAKTKLNVERLSEGEQSRCLEAMGLSSENKFENNE